MISGLWCIKIFQVSRNEKEQFPWNAPRMQKIGRSPTQGDVEEHISTERRCLKLGGGVLYLCRVWAVIAHFIQTHSSQCKLFCMHQVYWKHLSSLRKIWAPDYLGFFPNKKSGQLEIHLSYKKVQNFSVQYPVVMLSVPVTHLFCCCGDGSW